MLQQSLGQVQVNLETGKIIINEQDRDVLFDRSAHEKTDMKHSFPHTPPALHQPAVLRVLLWKLLISIVSNHLIQQVRVLELEIKSCITQRLYLRELFAGRSVSVAETRQVDAVDPLPRSSIVQILGNLHPDGVIQLLVITSDHCLLTQVHQQTLQSSSIISTEDTQLT